MKEKNKTYTKDNLPVGWPKDVLLPTQEEVEATVKRGEKMIADDHRELRTKIKGTSPEMLNTQITI